MRVFELHIRARDGAWATLRRRPRSRTVDICMFVGPATTKRTVPAADSVAIDETAREMATILEGGGNRATNARRYRDAIRLMGGG